MKYSANQKSKEITRFWLSFVSSLLISTFYAQVLAAKTDVIERVVAVVNGKVILLSELQENADQLSKELKERGESSGKADEKGFQKKVLDQLINHELVSEEVRRRGLNANDSTIDSAITSVMTQNGMKSAQDLEMALSKEGISLETYRDTIKRQIEDSRLMSEVIRPRVNLTESDVRAAYERKYTGKGAKLRYHVNMIFKKGSKGQKDLKKLATQISTGSSFEELANLETEGPGKGEGGSIGVVDLANLHPKLAKAVRSLKPNQVSSMILTEQGAYLLKLVEEVREGETPYAQVRDEIEAGLRRSETNRKFESFLRALRENALIEEML